MKRSLVIEMSDVLRDEGFFPGGDALHIDLRALDGTSCYCSAEAADAIRKEIGSIADIAERPVRWIDTGDYHYLSALLVEQTGLPSVELLLYDNHPDDQPLAFEEPGMLSCGSWVAYLRGRGLVREGGPHEDLPLYVSVDTDVLSESEFRTDWDQGSLTMDALLEDIASKTAGREVVALDICGGLTLSKGATPEDLRLNRRGREQIEKFIQTLAFTPARR